MKKNLLLLAAILYVVAASAQDTKKVFGSTTLVWYGIEFTKAKMVGFGDESPHTIRDVDFKSWNELTTNMDLAKVFQKSAVYKDPKGITKINSERETETLVSNDDKELAASDIADAVKQVPLGQKKEGVGVVFVVQSFNKSAEAANVWVTFFDIKTQEVLWTKKVVGKPSGGNVVASWSGALKNVFSAVEKKEFSAWRKEAKY